MANKVASAAKAGAGAGARPKTHGVPFFRRVKLVQPKGGSGDSIKEGQNWPTK